MADGYFIFHSKRRTEAHLRRDWRQQRRPEGGETIGDLPILKIADFGLAQVSGVKNMRKWDYCFCGTPTYMSPESIVGQIWGALDVWSLGCIVIEMITGRTAWRNYQGPEDMRDKLLRGQKPDIPENMSTWGKDFLKRCFGSGPNERWTARMLLERTHSFNPSPRPSYCHLR
ncbi:hypothetical protein CCACVL1_09297 [Corchorus capsularis]|uniref:Protein kinase domain-containing protein n=1 Tax=Corchorus capsularis TaxID=210143 RepID=A0A1R3IWT5_COCAP|nr:hypothetical protein CCACVL1_09297 [Corchorus capsularis]